MESKEQIFILIKEVPHYNINPTKLLNKKQARIYGFYYLVVLNKY
jgi:hypothetical protein